MRFVKFLVAVAIFLSALYLLLLLPEQRGARFAFFGLSLPRYTAAGLSIIGMIFGALLARKTVIEELAVTSD